MKNTLNILGDHELISRYRIHGNQEIVEFIIDRHFPLLKKLSLSHLQKFPNTTFEDNIQNAKLATIIAIQRFNTQSENKFVTFLYSTVFHYLLSCNDEESFVKCPSNIREIRSYFAGKYDIDIEKKKKFEKKYNLNTEKDIQDLSRKYQIVGDSIVLTDELPEVEVKEDIFSNLNYNFFVERLSQEDQMIVNLLIEGHSMNNIAKIVSKNTKKTITGKQIKNKIVSMQANLSV
jgi:DNA-directed RNA polymerase specialized sigma subunit